MKIKICFEFPKVYKLQRKLMHTYPEYNIIIEHCIGDMCKKCKYQPVCKLKKKKLKARDISSLIAKIEKNL